MDKIVVETLSAKRVRTCVSCGFNEPAPERSFSTQPTTRLEQSATTAKPINFVP